MYRIQFKCNKILLLAMFSNATKNFSNTIKTRPPLIVFTVCLLGIIITTISLAYYVRGHDKLVNSDIKTDWLSLITYLKKHNICVENDSQSSLQAENEGTVSVGVLAKVSPSLANESAIVQGTIPLDGWFSKCPDKTEVPQQLHIAFTLPVVQNQDICVLITGPANFMPNLSNQKLCEPTINLNLKRKKFTSKLASSTQTRDGFCNKGTLGQLEYSIDYNKNIKFDNTFLSLDDRLTITTHLIVTSCFLVFIVILITCYALCNKRNFNNGSSDSKHLLMSKGIRI